jgi:hypothetical protein
MTEATLPITGGCLCRAVRYTVTAAPLGARTCWCRLCQYLGAGTATANVIFPADAVEIDGALTAYESVADSGSHLTRGFCPACGTPVTSHAAERPHLIVLRAGTLDDPGLIGPEVTIWADEAPAWACISETIPRYPAQIPPVG